jgi:subtilisin
MFWNKPKDELRPFLPDFSVVQVAQTLSQTVDWGLKMIKPEGVWDITKGDDIKVCILDTGRPLNHPDLEANIQGSATFVPGEDMYDMSSGHSTHCAGIVGAIDNNIGVVGVAPECQLYFGKVLSNNGLGKFEWIADGIQWAIDLQVDIISMSLGSTAKPPNNRIEKLLDKAVSHGIIPVAAAGNEGDKSVNYPAKYPSCLAVSAIDKSKNITSWSNTGTDIDVAAPGDDIYSTYLGKSYAILSGTSQAAPFISGVLALCRSWCRVENVASCNNIEQARHHLEKISSDLGQVGKDSVYGYGLPILEKLGAEKINKKTQECKDKSGCLWPF